MPKRSAGLLMYRRSGGQLEVLLVHPGGPFWMKKDLGAWTIPKGEYGPGEEPLAAAIREFQEETGLVASGPFRLLTPVRHPAARSLTHGPLKAPVTQGRSRAIAFPSSGREARDECRSFPKWTGPAGSESRQRGGKSFAAKRASWTSSRPGRHDVRVGD